MNLKRPLIIAGAMTLGSAALWAWGSLELPATARIPMNYGLDGHPHTYAPPIEGLAIFPLVTATVIAALAVAPRLRGNPEGLERSQDAYGLLITALAGLFLVAQSAFVMQALDPKFDTLRWVFLATAVLLVLVGNTLGKVRHNTIFGVRTRWTLRDARVWDKTHRLTGWLMVAGALVLAAVAILIPIHWLLIAALVAAVAGPLVTGAVYSARISAQA